jgi:tRNA threonylcarbamoyladenosine biosynthesis protein TsaE
MRIELLSTSEEHTEIIGAAIGHALRPGDVAALHGDLGAGKTCLVRGIAQGMGLDPAQVSSPTFVIVNEYQKGETSLVHVDAYRLRGADELDSLGWERLLDGRSVVAVEWAEKIDGSGGGGLPGPERRLDILLSACDDPNQRRIVVEGADSWAPRLSEAFADAGASAGPEPRPRDDQPIPPGWARCPISGRPVPPDSPTFPFFDAKCRMADLGRWLAGSYNISRELSEEDVVDPEAS